jgi:hypothetical protein
MHESETPIGIHYQFLAVSGEDTVDISTVYLVEKSKE